MKKREDAEGKKTGRPSKPMPEPISDTPENIMRTLANGAPRKARTGST